MNISNRNPNAIREQEKRPTLDCLNYNITYEPLPHESLNLLPHPVQERTKALYNLALSQPQQAIAPLLDMIEKYPMVPVFYNYLRVAYEATGQTEKAEAILEVIYRKHPHYLFAKTNYAFRCLRRGMLEKIPEIFNNKFDLQLLYPERDVFHVSEFTAFTGVIALYYFMIGDRDNAVIHYKRLQHCTPNHHLTQIVKTQLYPTFFQRLFDQLGRAVDKIFGKMESKVKENIEALENVEASDSQRTSSFSKTF